MKKNKNNRKRKWKTLARLALIQVCIVLFYVLLCTTSHPYQKESCVSRQIVVDNIQYVRVYGEPRCRVTSDGVFYEFPGLGIFDEFSGREIYEQLHLGDALDILYVKERSLFRCYNLIVDAKDATTTYLRLDAYNSEIAHASIAVHIIFLIIELLYIGGCMWWYMMFNRKRAEPRKRKKKQGEIQP